MRDIVAGMMVVAVSAWLMVVCSGLTAGGILLVAVERTNQWTRMPIEQYAVDFRRSLYRLDPLLPILGGISGVGAVVFALNVDGLSAWLAWVGVALVVLIIGGSTLIAEPMNSKFRRLPEGGIPEGAERIRTVWRRFHWTRTVVAVGACAVLAAAAIA